MIPAAIVTLRSWLQLSALRFLLSAFLTCIDERVGSDALRRHYIILVRAHRVIVFDIEIVFLLSEAFG